MTVAPSQDQIFSPRTVLILVGVSLFAMLASILVISFGNEQETYTTTRQNSFSVSAIGHKAFVNSLKHQNIPVLISQYKTAERLAPNSILMLLEPDLNFSKPEILEKLLTHETKILVLPKRRGARRGFQNPRWLSKTYLTSYEAPEKILKMVDPLASIYRPYHPRKEKKTLEEDLKTSTEEKTELEKAPNESSGHDPDEVKEEPLDWTVTKIKDMPDLLNPQLMRSDKIEPLLATKDGILVGMMFGDLGTTIVISDPDILSNFGLGRGDNAAIMQYVVDFLRVGNNTIFVDETSHGFTRNPDFIRSAFEYPFIFVTLQVLIFTVLLVWATAQRFGTPQKTKPALKPGKAVLIQNTVNLLNAGDHKPEILVRYVDLTLHAMARRLRVPRHLDEADTIHWLDEYGRKHNVHMEFRVIKHRAQMLNSKTGPRSHSFMDVVHDKPLLQIALHLEKWKQEMLDGSGTDKLNQ
ncbi:DUF4350 domain-containing protein [Paremcibacter congregatus]|uniref:DUF4350 domain-containing protein n=1 Tax=Paremcibacter congregatus TaxID=2043170 RepID=A0A2G4YXV7_9PROT|nr:DUF4350 domain-containing protein [Paremcibacter congregatus]PHZ86266.1 hypothetical protein CRD36_06265 [Paremcibacter congregatus]QDE27233.1 hypothetical protein FIV45_08030 [Paremcibacter congregatus]